MADTTTTTIPNIGDISSQLTKASRLVVTTDGFWIQTGGDSAGNGQSVLIPAEFVKAYLTDAITPTVGDDGYWYVGGVSTGVKAEGVTPKLRGGTLGIEASYDGGETWQQAVAYSDIDLDLEPLEAEYKKTIEGEASRVEAENARVEAETARVNAEEARVTAENGRVTAENNRVSAEKKREEVKAEMEELNAHPDYIDDTDGYWYTWDLTTHAYVKTDKLGTGGVIYPTFVVADNCLYVGDGKDDNLADRVKIQDNSLVLDMV